MLFRAGQGQNPKPCKFIATTLFVLHCPALCATLKAVQKKGKSSCFNPSGFCSGFYGSASPCLLAQFWVVLASGAIMSSVYFGGSRSLAPSPLLAQVVQAVQAAGHYIHVGCQFGADQQVIQSAGLSSLVIFAVSPFLSSCAEHIRTACHLGARVVVGAGGSSAPIKARFLLRSIAAFQGCSQAVFFSPGPGSLAVAREAVKSGLPVFVIGWQSIPQPIPSSLGYWVASSFMGFPAWRWLSAQLSFI